MQVDNLFVSQSCPFVPAAPFSPATILVIEAFLFLHMFQLSHFFVYLSYLIYLYLYLYLIYLYCTVCAGSANLCSDSFCRTHFPSQGPVHEHFCLFLIPR